MAHVLCLATGLTGMLHATFEVVRRLEAAGHRVTLACGWPEVTDSIQRQGISLRPLDPVNFSPASIEDLKMDGFGVALDELKPELVLADIEMPEHIVTVLARGIPLGGLNQFVCFNRRPGLPPIHHRTIPGEGFRGSRLGIALAWERLRSRQRRTRQRRAGRVNVLRAYARKVGVDEREFDLGSWLNPFGYRTLPILSLAAWEFEFPHPRQPNLHYVGPMVATHRVDAPHPDLEHEVERTLERASGRPLVYVSVSSKAAGDATFVRNTIDGLRKRDDWEVVIGLGAQLNARELGELPQHIQVFDWVPQLRMLQHAACSVNHGGIHSIHESLHHRLPMLVYSGKRYDQNGNAARVQFHGLGLAGDKDADDPTTIGRRVAEVIEEPRFRSAVAAMQDTIDGYGQNRSLERAVDALLAGKPPGE